MSNYYNDFLKEKEFNIIMNWYIFVIGIKNIELQNIKQNWIGIESRLSCIVWI